MSGLSFDPRIQSAIGMVAFWAIAWLFSERKLKLPPIQRFVAVVAFQVGLAFIFLQIPAARDSLVAVNGIVLALSEATGTATDFLFGYVGRSDNMPFAPAEGENPGLFIFAFQALPLIVVVSALAAVLWHWGILKIIIRSFSLVLQGLLGTGGAISLSAAANVILGQSEAPLLIRPLLRNLSRSELFAVITCGFATVAGTVMTLYAFILSPISEAMLGHIFVASVISVPSALLFSELMVPPEKGEVPTKVDETASGFAYENTMDAFTAGATEGGKLWANIVVAILAFIALASLINLILGGLPEVFGEPLTLERLLGFVFAPLVWLAGVPWEQAGAAGQLMGIKTILNEVIAYTSLVSLEDGTLDDRSTLIMVYALCGFANIASLGIIIGGLGVLEESRRSDIIALAPRALISGTLATLSSGAAIGIVF
ncbi:nucleoside:proton symporter [Parvularcula sp. ZS-1/3]|uniref:Nucleoside:proton symporter n=1 Tax=Parvularcula mediterranea TaxID=2732508 RepID=A0A7Y3RJ69_9PROT|nr:nucleoside transporter C-terminal domain-containing protein [Parvularcula mediterranea]NNU15032.1 nucleoside:proton symporter [Parvularcula mediterranea]